MAGSCVVVRRLDEKLEQGLLCVKTVFRLIPGDRALVIEQVEADFFATVGRQAMHEQHIRLRPDRAGHG